MPLYQYTGQASYMDDPLTSGVTEGFGLMFYNARWYDPYLNHFSQPDSIVPDPYNSQDYDRYSYARNNPIRYNDPSGHMVWDGDEGTNTCNDPDFCENGQVKPYAGIAYTLRLARSARNGEERGWYYNRAFYLTISQFDIAIPYDENHPLHISLGGIDSSWNDPTTPAGTYYTPVTPDYPEGSPDIRINIYNAAFESTPGDLAATISHEFCHANQASGTGCSTNPPTTGERWYTSGIGGAVNEIEARQAVLSNLSAYGYGTTYGITQGKIDQYNIDISSLRNQYDPYPDFYNAITTQVYTLPY